jgi:hypothetical protein
MPITHPFFSDISTLRKYLAHEFLATPSPPAPNVLPYPPAPEVPFIVNEPHDLAAVMDIPKSLSKIL